MEQNPWDHMPLSIDITEVDVITDNTNRQLTQQPGWNPLRGAHFALVFRVFSVQGNLADTPPVRTITIMEVGSRSSSTGTGVAFPSDGPGSLGSQLNPI